MDTASQSDSSKGASAGTSNIRASVFENPHPPTENFFSRDSAIWRITREQVLLLGGPAAAILQIAHPAVALGVANHSDFRADTLGRLRRTLDAVYTITFAPHAEVEAMAERVRAAHVRVRGASPQRYSAFSPDAQMWVLTTLIQLSVEMFERFVAPLTPVEKNAFLRDMRIFGVWFGLPAGHGPQGWTEFSAYYHDMLASEIMCSLPISTELAHHIVYPRKPAGLRVLWPLASFTAREFLPSPIREKLLLPRTPGSRLTAATLDALLPRLLPGLPPTLRFAPRYLQASDLQIHPGAGMGIVENG
ncbi:MAG TPA: oxygenase MpaB family protein [Chthoniobacterales bacterium]